MNAKRLVPIRRAVCLLSGFLLLINHVLATDSTSFRDRVFFDLNTSFRSMFLNYFNGNMGFHGMLGSSGENAKPIKTGVETVVNAGIILGKNKEHFLRLGFGLMPDYRRKNSSFWAFHDKNDSTFKDSTSWQYYTQSRIRCYTIEVGRFYSFRKLTTDIGFGISFNTLRYSGTSRRIQVYNFTFIDSDSVMHILNGGTYDEERENFHNHGFGILACGGISYQVKRKLDVTGNLRLFLAGIRIRDSQPAYIYTPFGYYEDPVIANLSGFSVGMGLRYHL